MSGIGAIIIILQAGPLVGHSAHSGGVLATLALLPSFMANPVIDALVLGAVSLAIVYGTPERVGKVVPSPLLALLVGTVLGVVAFPDSPVIGAIPTHFPIPVLPSLHLDAVKVVIGQAIVLAVLGSLDSLLTSLACDNMTRTHHDSNRELIGQGVGNAVAGLFGGLPGAGATMRSVINIRTGGRTPISGALHAVVLLAVLLGLGPLAERIPLAVLAGILVSGVDIIDWRSSHVFKRPAPM
jgi:SulP family sulfate permease